MDELQTVTIFDLPHYGEEDGELLENREEYLEEIEWIIEEYISVFGETSASYYLFYPRGIDFNDVVSFYDEELVNNLDWEVLDDFPTVDDFETIGYVRNQQMLIVTLIPLANEDTDCVLLVLADDPDYVDYDYDRQPEEEVFVQE